MSALTRRELLAALAATPIASRRDLGAVPFPQ